MKPRRPGPALLLAGCAVSALLCARPALAQQAAPAAPAGGTVELAPIEVQGARPAGTAYEQATGPVPGFTATESTAGTKTGTPIVDTPASVSVVGQKQIQATGAQTVTGALEYTPGVFANTFGFDPRTDWFLIRGFEANTDGYYLDGLQLFDFGFAGYQLDPWTLERIDILRGPASALYGGSGPGGIIDNVSKRPTLVPYHRVEVGVNNFGNAYGAFDVSGPVAAGSPWYYRVAAKGYGGGTQVDDTDFDRGVVAPSLSYRPDGATTLTFLGQYQRDFTQAGPFLPYEGTVRPAPYGRISTSTFTGSPGYSTFEREQSFVGYEFEHAFANNIVVRQNLRYAFVDTLNRGPYGIGYDGSPSSADLLRINFLAPERGRQLALDNQVQGNVDAFGIHNVLLGGLDYKHFDFNNNQGVGSATDFNLVTRVYGPAPANPDTRYLFARNVQDQVGLYAQDQARFNRLSLVLSGREDIVNTDSDNRLIPSLSREATPTRFTGRAAAIYDAGLDLHPYVGYATSFNPIVGTNPSTQLPLRPEDGEQEEVGIKYGADKGPILATLALFNLTRTNVLTTNQNPDLTQTQTQTGEERSRGVELGLNATLANGLSAVGSFTAYDIKNTKDGDASIVGKVPVDVPEILSSLFVDYTIPDGTLRGLGFGAGERFVGSSFADNVNTLRVPDYWLTDASLHYERDGYRVAITAQNLFDRTYVGSCSAPTACFYGYRRTILGTLTYTW